MARLGAIDIGTNSVKLLVADVDPDGNLEIVHDESRTTGLGEGVSQTGMLSAAAIERTAYAVTEYAEHAKDLGAEATRAAGTAALRNTQNTNAHEFLEVVRDSCGLEVRVLSAEQELELARGATLSAFEDANPLVVADIGGGSTEITVVIDGAIVEAQSYDAGARNMTEAFRDIKPFHPENTIGYEQAVWNRFHGLGTTDAWVEVRQSRSKVLVLQGGTAYCAARLAAGDKSENLHGATFQSMVLPLMTQQVRSMPEADLKKLLHFDPDRAPVLYAGLMIADFICAACYAERFTFSEYSLRHGMVLAAEW